MRTDTSSGDLEGLAAAVDVRYRLPADGEVGRLDGLLRRLRGACWPRAAPGQSCWQPRAAGERSCWQSLAARLDHFFDISRRGSTIPTEVRAGCVSFMTMSYIMLVNPVLLYKVSPGSGLAFEALLTATALASTAGSLLVGLLGNAPVGLLPGLRLNAYFVFGFCQNLGVPWGEALSCCFVSGALLLLLAVLGVSDWLLRTVLTEHLKKAIAVAMGIFQATIGLQMMGFDVPGQPALLDLRCEGGELMTLATVQCSGLGVSLALGTFCLLSCLLVAKRMNGALLLGIVLIAVGSWAFGLAEPPQRLLAAPRFDASLSLDFQGWLAGRGKLGSMLLGTSMMLFVALSDIAGVKHGLYSIAGLLRHGRVPRSRSIVASAALGTMAGAVLGTSPLIIANESSAGIIEGARTGLSAVVVAALFALAAFTAPLLTAIPDLAAAAPLVLTGAFMMDPSRTIAWNNLRVAIPSFVTIMLMPMSVHHGITAGILMDVLLGRLDALLARVPRLLKGGGASGPARGPPTPTRPERHRLLSDVDLLFPTPQSFAPMGAIGGRLKEAEKVERVRQLLNDLGPPCSGMMASETWEIALRQALQSYLSGMSFELAAARP